MNGPSPTTLRQELLRLVYYFRRDHLSPSQFCHLVETWYLEDLVNQKLSDRDQQAFGELFGWCISYRPLIDDDETYVVVDTFSENLIASALDVPHPVDFAAAWGVESVDKDEDWLTWAYDLGDHADASVTLTFNGVERWLSTTVESGGARSSTALWGLTRLEFQDHGTSLPVLVGDFDAGTARAQIVVDVNDGVNIDWQPVGRTGAWSEFPSR